MEKIFEGLGFEDLLEPVKVEMSTAFSKVFNRYVRIVNPEGGGEQVYAFDTLRLLKSMWRTWSELYASFSLSQEEFPRDKYLLEQEVKKLSEIKDSLIKKLAGELEMSL